MTLPMTNTCTVPIEVQFLQSQIRIAQEDFNRAKLRLQALEALMPKSDGDVKRNKGQEWRVPLSRDKEKRKSI